MGENQLIWIFILYSFQNPFAIVVTFLKIWLWIFPVKLSISCKFLLRKYHFINETLSDSGLVFPLLFRDRGLIFFELSMKNIFFSFHNFGRTAFILHSFLLRLSLLFLSFFSVNAISMIDFAIKSTLVTCLSIDRYYRGVI